ncbi:hypothetical protein ACPV5G_16095 [Photobacterium damselae]|uniref:hypothetical protein n=1 Tax=Photobacterium damselae TaxID=38293 RepID=UPI004068F74C
MRKLTQRTLATLLLATPLFALADTKAANNQVELATPLESRVVVKVIPDCKVVRPKEVFYGDISKGVTRMPFNITIVCTPLATSHLKVLGDRRNMNRERTAVKLDGRRGRMLLEIIDNGRPVKLDNSEAICSGLENRRCQLEGRVTINEARTHNFSTHVEFTHVLD